MTVSPEKENPFLNGIRGISALMIIFYHCFIILFMAIKDKSIVFLNNEVPDVLLFLFSFDKSVDIFFILSAYLLTGQLIYELNKKGEINYASFFRRRWFRIYPLFFFSLCIYSLLYLNHLTFSGVVANLLMVGNLAGHNIIPVGWTLDVEMQFYLLIPLAAVIIFKMKNHLLTIALLLGSLAIRYFVAQDIPTEALEATTYELLTGEHKKVFMHEMYYPTYTRFGTLIMGMVWAYAEKSKLVQNLSKVSASIIFIIASAVLIFILHYPVFYIDQWNLGNSPLLTVTHRHIFSVCFVAIAILVNLRLLPKFPGKVIYKFFSHGILRIFSQLSYAIYLFHFPFVAVALVIVFRTTKPENIIDPNLGHIFMAWILSTLLTIPLAYVLHKYIEIPFMEKGRKPKIIAKDCIV